MILDAFMTFTASVSLPGTTIKFADNVTATGGTSTNQLDLAIGQTNTTGGLPLSATSPNTQPMRDIGIGDDPALKILIQSIGPNWAGATSLTVSLQCAPDSGTGTPGSFTTYYTSNSATLAQLNAGARLMDMDFPRPPFGVAEPRFIQLLYNVTGGPFTGTANFLVGSIVLDRADQVYNGTVNTVWGGYPAGITVAN
jgi:hypothetical protein